jgi:hypothetical protein
LVVVVADDVVLVLVLVEVAELGVFVVVVGATAGFFFGSGCGALLLLPNPLFLPPPPPAAACSGTSDVGRRVFVTHELDRDLDSDEKAVVVLALERAKRINIPVEYKGDFMTDEL